MPVIGSNTAQETEYISSAGVGEIYLGTTLVQNSSNPNPFIRATGGTITTSGSYKIHTYTTVGTSSFDIIGLGSGSTNNTIEYLVVAGGGAGGISTNGQGLGGGAGGMLTGSYTSASVSSYPVIVGAGGIGSNATNNNSTSGSISSLFGLTAFGGGTQNVAGGNGGSGAGLGTGTAGQGNNGGGTGVDIPGGGGAGSVGFDGGHSCPGYKLPGLTGGNGGVASALHIQKDQIKHDTGDGKTYMTVASKPEPAIIKGSMDLNLPKAKVNKRKK